MSASFGLYRLRRLLFYNCVLRASRDLLLRMQKEQAIMCPSVFFSERKEKARPFVLNRSLGVVEFWPAENAVLLCEIDIDAERG